MMAFDRKKNMRFHHLALLVASEEAQLDMENALRE